MPNFADYLIEDIETETAQVQAIIDACVAATLSMELPE